MKPIDVGQYLVVDQRVCHGKLTFKGTRIPVQTVLTFLVKGDTLDAIEASWPELRREAIEETIRLAGVSWPELLQKKAGEALERLAAALKKRDTLKRRAHEPARSGRSA